MTSMTSVKTIRVRFKQGEVPGDASGFNDYGVDNGFPRLVYPGAEMDIPADLLDEKEEFIMYRFPDKSEKMLTEKEHRAALYKYGGYTSNTHYAEPAPLASSNKSIILPPRQMNQTEHVQFLKKQREATLKYKHFNPCSMELISEEKETAPNKEDEAQFKTSGSPDLLKMSKKEGIDYIKSIKDETFLSELSIIMDKAKNVEPVWFQVLEMQLKSLRGQ